MKIEKSDKEIVNQISDISGKKITRKEAIKKTGYMAISTATMMILLNKKSSGTPNTSYAGGGSSSGASSSGNGASSS